MEIESNVSHTDLDTSGIQNTKGPFEDIDDFLDAVNDAQEGDLIILANDSYDVDDDKHTSFSNRKGTAKNPIIVRAQDVGGAKLKGKALYRFDNCEYFTWYGFNHAHEASTNENNIIFEGGNNNRFARCEIKLDDKRDNTHWLNISNCRAMKVDHCYFHHKETKGNFCIVGFNSDNKGGEGPLFEYNYFLHQDLNLHVDPEEIGDAGGEAVRMGHSDMDRTYFRAIFRYNYLEKCNGDGEAVTNKSSGNIYYNNSWEDNIGSLVLRHGDSTAVLGNYFEKCGLRIGGADNLIANNHFTRNSHSVDSRWPLVIMNGDVERPNNPGGNMERVVNNDIILNTFANGDGTAKQIVRWGWKQGSDRKPTDNRFRGNIITGQHGKLLSFESGATATGDSDRPNNISDNIAWITGDADYHQLTPEMATWIDPKLTRDSNDGIYRLQSNSPARNKFQGRPFEELTTVDIDGEERGPNTDAGCDQFSTESTTIPKKRITREDVGPKATTDLGDSPDWNPPPVNPRE
jgi:hypothetical protein